MGVLGYPDHLLNSTQNIDLRLILAMGYRGLVNLQYAIDNKLFPNIALLKGATNKTMANFAFRMGFGLRIPHTYSTDDLEYLTKNNIVLNYQPNLNNNPYNLER